MGLVCGVQLGWHPSVAIYDLKKPSSHGGESMSKMNLHITNESFYLKLKYSS